MSGPSELLPKPAGTHVLFEKTEDWEEGGRYSVTTQTLLLPLFSDYFETQRTFCHEVIGSEPEFLIGLNAGTHGDEETSIVAVQNIVRGASFGLVAGKLVAIPYANPGAIERRSRLVDYTPSGEADLNRSFTLKPASKIEQHAFAILDYFRKHYESQQASKKQRGEDVSSQWPFGGLIIDLHTEDIISGSSPESNVLPYLRIDPSENDDLLGFTMYCAIVAGIPWVMEYATESYKEEGLDRSLTAVLGQQLNIPAITFEAGPGGAVFPRFVTMADQVMQRLFEHFKMRIQDQPDVEGTWSEDPDLIGKLPQIGDGNFPLKLDDAYACDQDGKPIESQGRLILDQIKPGDFVRKGQPIGRIEDSVVPWKESIVVFAPFDGWVLSESPVQIRHQKGTLAYMAAVPITDDERLIRIYRKQKELLSSHDS